MVRLQRLVLLVAQPVLDFAAHLFGNALDFPEIHLDSGVAEQILRRLFQLGLAASAGH